MIENFRLGMVKNGCGQSGKGTIKLTISEEWTDEMADFLHVDTDLQKLNADQKFSGWAWPKMGVTCLVMGLYNWLYLRKEHMDETDFFACWYKFMQIKRGLKIFGVGVV